MVASTFVALAIAIALAPETMAADSMDLTLPPGAVVCFPPRPTKRLLKDSLAVHQPA